MKETNRILDQMGRAFAGDAWHGPSLMRLLDGIAAEDASRHPLPQAHSIWELVHHVSAWKGIVLHRLMGQAGEVTAERDWPPVWDTSEIAWRRALESLAESQERLAEFAAGVTDEQLDEMPRGCEHTRYAMLHGVVQHDLYHAGQIAVLKKALG
ncbi:MAG TPA: DinB family protein [Candidatus Acidoferrales bacterium]|nr:DinB family protein [Candidatus Acidoferrales bacterium]